MCQDGCVGVCMSVCECVHVKKMSEVNMVKYFELFNLIQSLIRSSYPTNFIQIEYDIFFPIFTINIVIYKNLATLLC